MHIKHDCIKTIVILIRSDCTVDGCGEANKDKNVMFTLEQAMKAQRGSRGIALLFL
jgi:hypothetical protein